ncbi:uncharacterized protein HMPREF1541_10838 [Cyphellophora europaea CBS 101466]|uniref:Uncharacterized protein n=1 Tax=Cyphellophora europaea (strain CBS 101466) TaxID=1220924 RepID=W2S7F9_CYPE1|nr:uncharacterized protein HMPREF1541_10838 [Cyphellophora europaea CBS 101466]ETN43973.1 hypothetical protein HMPREF1541_10838 [Cyphellophora europaea CBS 101466]
MDPASISIGAVQIAFACGQATVTIIKWVNDVRSAGERIQGFYEEILALKATYDGLSDCLKSPVMAEAARTSNKANDGRHLWAQVKTALDDSRLTIKEINHHLDKISKASGILKKARSHLEESLRKGELGRLRERIRFFNTTISLPIQMVCVMLQLEQRDQSAESQRNLDRRFVQIEQTMRELIVSLTYQSDTTLRGETLIVGSTDSRQDPRGRDNYLTFARRILTSASAAASTRSTYSTISPRIEPPAPLELRGNLPELNNSEFQRSRRTIPDWISASNPEQFTDQVAQTLGNNSTDGREPAQAKVSDAVDFRLAQRYLKNGQEKAAEGQHESAERNFKKALELLAKYDFSNRIAFQPAEVVLMLSQSCLKQQKHDEAIALLTPVADGKVNIFPSSVDVADEAIPAQYRPDKLQSLAASHQLGEAYRAKGDFERGKVHARKAFMDRTDELGETDEKTLESVQLLIDIYRDMGAEEDAEAYEEFLTPSPMTKKPAESIDTDTPSDEPTITSSVSPPASEVRGVPATSSPAPPRKATRGWRDKLSRNMLGRNHSASLRDTRSGSDDRKTSFSRTTTLNSTIPETPSSFTSPHLQFQTSNINVPSTTSSPINQLTSPASDSAPPSHHRLSSRADSWNSEALDHGMLTPNIAFNPASAAMLEPHFKAVAEHCAANKLDKAATVGLKFLEGYDSRNFIIRRDELESNIKKGTSRARGLAATGKGYAPIHYFCEMRDECAAEVAMLVRYGVDVNTVCYKAGFKAGPELTPLGLAIRAGHTRVARILLEVSGVKVDTRDGEGMTPLMVATRSRLYEVVRLMLEKHYPQCVPTGEAKWPKGWYGNSLLHDAARHCDAQLVTLLLEKGIEDVNGVDRFGKTPLMYAIIKSDVFEEKKQKLCRERVKVVRKLVEFGADVNQIDKHGYTAATYAAREEDEELKAAVGEPRFELPVTDV